MSGTTADAVDYGDVQGIVRFGYKHLTDACYLLLTVANARSARDWLQRAPIASAAEMDPTPTTALQAAFTATGLRALGVPDSVVTQFSSEFVSGMAGADDRSRRLGDLGTNAPANWTWGGRDREPHVLAALFATPGTLDAFRATVVSGWGDAFALTACLDTVDLNGVEQFGFVDGISQPVIDWQLQRALRGDKTRYGNLVALGEFLLGYPNEYGCYTQRPLVEAAEGSDLLPPAADDATKRDVGRNGTYLVFRDLRQDVRAFWQFAQTRAAGVRLSPGDLASAFVGRKLNGDPLVAIADGPIEGIDGTPQAIAQNRFTYDGDPEGVRCPLGAHVRRSNPRNADFAGDPSGPIATLGRMLGFPKSAFRDDLVSSTRFHRIMRRGREYGPPLSPVEAQAPPTPGDLPRGLRFVCVNANITRQFEFLQNAWISNGKFAGLRDESDPLLGNPERAAGSSPTNGFVLNREDRARERVTDMAQFVTVTGGAYFFLPGLRALQYIARVGAEEGL